MQNNHAEWANVLAPAVMTTLQATIDTLDQSGVTHDPETVAMNFFQNAARQAAQADMDQDRTMHAAVQRLQAAGRPSMMLTDGQGSLVDVRRTRQKGDGKRASTNHLHGEQLNEEANRQTLSRNPSQWTAQQVGRRQQPASSVPQSNHNFQHLTAATVGWKRNSSGTPVDSGRHQVPTGAVRRRDQLNPGVGVLSGERLNQQRRDQPPAAVTPRPPSEYVDVDLTTPTQAASARTTASEGGTTAPDTANTGVSNRKFVKRLKKRVKKTLANPSISASETNTAAFLVVSLKALAMSVSCRFSRVTMMKIAMKKKILPLKKLVMP